MPDLTRREFLGRALLTGAGAQVFRSLAPPSANAQEANLYLTDVDPGFAQGEVTGWNPTLAELTVVNPHDFEEYRLTMPLGTSVWQNGKWGLEPPAVGSCVYARGETLGPGRFAVDRLWANISSEWGVVQGASSTEIVILTGDEIEKRYQILEGSVLEKAGYEGPAIPSLLPLDTMAYIISSLDLETQLEEATRIILMDGNGVSGGSDGMLDQQRRVFFGLTTWFCCGGSGGCGCGSAPQGFCASSWPCRSDRRHIAWPRVQGSCPPTCGNCCINTSEFPCLPCNYQVDVANPCTGAAITTYIRDRGPQIHCVSPRGCNQYRTVKFDLTPCAFSAIGNLDRGILNCHATVYLF